MKAAQIGEYGDQGVLKTVADAPKPAPTAGQVLVAVRAAGVNPFDWKLRAGYMQQAIHLPFPATLGGDVAGVVTEVGSDVTGFTVGDEVYGMADAAGGHGSFAEFTPVVASQLALKPQGVDFTVAAAVPLAAGSAHQALVDHMRLQAGQKILIHGGAGGIGSFAIQLAKHLGAHVATTAAGHDAEFVQELGADEVIDYATQEFEKLIKNYDAVYDTVGGATNAKSYQVLRPGGVLVAMVEPENREQAARYNIRYVAQGTRVNSERLVELGRLVQQGVLKAYVDKTFPLEKAAEALAYLQSTKHHGKVVITV